MIQRFHWVILPSLILLGALAWGAVASFEKPRPASQILKDHDAVEFPLFCSKGEEEPYFRETNECARKQCRLAFELYESYPGHAQIVRVMKSRWDLMGSCFREYREVCEETGNIIALEGDTPLARAARIRRAFAGMELREFDIEDKRRMVEEAIAADPDNAREAVRLLNALASKHEPDPGRQKEICTRILKQYRQCPLAKGAVTYYRMLQRMGSEVAFEFEDLFTGRAGSLEEYRGRKVLLFFFDTFTMNPHGHRTLFEDLHRWRTSPDGEELAVIGFLVGCCESERDEVRQQAEGLHIDWPVHAPQSRFEKDPWSFALNVCGTPTLLLVDEQGRLAGFSRRVAPLRALAGEE